MTLNNQTIIIKRIKKVSGGAHGGAWKVAYADFVTAMMAFFLLLWLLNATEAENLAGLADYFAPTVGVKDEMGIGFRGGKGALSDGIGADKNTNKGIVFGGVPTGPITKVTTEILETTNQQEQEQIQVLINETDTQKKGTEDQQEDKAVSDNPQLSTETAEELKASEKIQKTEQALEAAIDEMVKDKRIDEGTVEIKRTPEGLIIEIKDISGNAMFEKDSPVMKVKLKESLTQLAKILKNVPNNYAIIGHTSSAQVVSKKAGYTKWELSSDRANTTRLFLEKNGVQPEQFSRVEGRADNVPYDAKKPEANINNRISIIILTKSDTPEHKKSAPNSILLDTKSDDAKKLIDDAKKKEDEQEQKEQENNKATPVKDNTDIKKLFDESANTAADAAKAKLPAEPAKPYDVIDLNVERKEVEEIKEDNKDINNAAQKIFDDAAKAAAQTKIPAANLKPADVIDLSVDKKAEVIKEDTSATGTNQQFQNIIKDIEKLKQQRPPQIPGQPAQ